jgi:hypothetical protein
LDLCGPSPTVISPACTSRADQSFISVNPAIPSPVSSRPAPSTGTPTTAAISSSKSSIALAAGRRTASSGPWIEAGFEK